MGRFRGLSLQGLQSRLRHGRAGDAQAEPSRRVAWRKLGPAPELPGRFDVRAHPGQSPRQRADPGAHAWVGLDRPAQRLERAGVLAQRDVRRPDQVQDVCPSDPGFPRLPQFGERFAVPARHMEGDSDVEAHALVARQGPFELRIQVDGGSIVALGHALAGQPV